MPSLLIFTVLRQFLSVCVFVFSCFFSGSAKQIFYSVVSTILFSIKNNRRSIVEFVSEHQGFLLPRSQLLKKGYSGDGMFTLCGLGYNFPNFHRSLSAKLHCWQQKLHNRYTIIQYCGDYLLTKTNFCFFASIRNPKTQEYKNMKT